jgi:hypothetical protein
MNVKFNPPIRPQGRGDLIGALALIVLIGVLTITLGG